LHVDVYVDAAVYRCDGPGARAFYEPLEPTLRAAAEGRLELNDVIDREGRAGAAERVVLEDGVQFAVDLARGQKGGLFLDQRENRLRVAALANGKRVLNLFGYTGGFSLHAATHGASHTDTVDIARPAIEAAQRNFVLNGLPPAAHGFYAEDAFEFLDHAAKHGET